MHHLAAPIRGAAVGKVTVVHAPPGFGKSVLLHAIAEIGRSHGGRGPAILDEVNRDALAALPRKMSASIDDGVILATRDITVAGEVGLRFPGRCEIISSHDLRLDVDAIEERLPEDRQHLAAAIHDLTGGWPLATFLLLANQRVLRDERPFAMPLFVDDYLSEYFERICTEQGDLEALQHLADLLDHGELTHAFIRSAFEGSDAIDLLRSLARRGLFVTETHDERPRFIVEPLFARFLRRRFAGTRPSEGYGARSLKLARGGFARPALRLAFLSDAPDAVAGVIEALGGMRVPLTLGYEAAEYFERIGNNALQQTDVLIARIYMSLQQGSVRFARDLMESLSPVAMARNVEAAHKLELLEFVIRFYENHVIPLAELDNYEQHHSEALCGDQIAKAVLQQLRASTHYFQNDLSESYACARYAMELANAVNAPLLTHYAKFYVALTEVRTGHLAHATALLDSASTMSGRELGAV